MAGARARKLDLSGYLSGNANVANLIVQGGENEARGIAGLFGGIAGGISQAGQNIRVDKQRADAKTERDEERTYQRGRDSFRDRLATKADARADADQRLQEDEAKRKVAADAMAVAETAGLLARAQAAAATGMPMDPKVLEEIQKRSTGIQSSGGPSAIMARAAAQQEEDPEGLVRETAQLDALSKLLIAQMGREKNPVRHAALGDSFMQLESVIASNKGRLKVHDANSKRKVDREDAEFEAQRKEVDALNAGMARLDVHGAMPTETTTENMAIGGPAAITGVPVQVTRPKPPKTAAEADELLKIARKAKGIEESPEDEGEALARRDIAKDATLRKAGIETPAAGRERAEKTRARNAKEEALRETVRDAERHERDAEQERAAVLLEKSKFSKEDWKKNYEDPIAAAREATRKASAALQGHLRGDDDVDEDVAAIENDTSLSAEEKLKRLDALEAKRAGR